MSPVYPLTERGSVQARIERLDHIALTVSDVDAACAFYSNAFGMEPVTLPGELRALRFGRQTLHLRAVSGGTDPRPRHARPGAADLCFVTEVPLDEISPHLAACGVGIVEGPVERPGSEGMLVSIYVHDPDGNLIELSNEIASMKVL
ncbi:MAG: VOC family protein [Acidobacteria bacterium]|nr:VOC family protein [Acidobacteriota bacterium]